MSKKRKKKSSPKTPTRTCENKLLQDNNPVCDQDYGNEDDMKELPRASEKEVNSDCFLSLNVAKVEGKGEDADPVVERVDNLYYVGVFDGMGGSGATEYPSNNGTHTGAYFASRRVKNICLNYIREAGCLNFDTDVLKGLIKTKLDEFASELDIKPSKLRSSIIRTLPTTLAMVRAEKTDGSTHVMSYWAGDSRNYIMKARGLCQISKDHLSKPQDPLENLRNDESLSNCICQDRLFDIEVHDCGQFNEPIIILSASDGCFGYLRTPMHFEYLLLKTLANSNTIDDWRESIIEWLKPVSGDDFSLGLAMVGGNMAYWKGVLNERLSYIENHVISKVEKFESDIEKAKQDVENAKANLYSGITTLWEEYKRDFMSK